MMSTDYYFEPSRLEVLLTSCVGNTLLRTYYRKFIANLDIHENDRILDFGCGCGILAKGMAKKLETGMLTYTDVSKTWLKVAKKRLRTYSNAEGFQMNEFNGKIGNGEFDKIVVHFTLHDFPKANLKPIITQLIKHLHPEGRLILREPIEQKHGLPLYEIYKVLESTQEISLKYTLCHHEIMGDFVEIVCRFKSAHQKKPLSAFESRKRQEVVYE